MAHGYRTRTVVAQGRISPLSTNRPRTPVFLANPEAFPAALMPDLSLEAASFVTFAKNPS
jgi:hypothetical protein